MARCAQSLYPSSVALLSQLGALLTHLTQFSEALACYNKALECEERECGKNTVHYAHSGANWYCAQYP